MKTIEETLKICKNENILTSYIQSKESEVVDILSFFMDQEEATQLMLEEERALARTQGREEGKEEGRSEGRAEGIAEGKFEGRIEQQEISIQTFAKQFKKMGISYEECLKALLEDYSDFDAEKLKSLVEKIY
ncbi:MAG: hypothetical protein Q4C49_11085 [Bacillota bacterium]|nr:hypothetical protein [Bacillota bacterium]